MGKFFRRLFGLNYRHPKPLARIPPWSELGRACIAIHIADASNVKKGRKGWNTVGGRVG